MKISYSFGMVDLMHYGHISALKRASEGADLHIFGLVSDEASDMFFGTHVSNESERRFVLESIKYIDEVIPQTTFDPLDNIERIHAKYPEAIITLFHGNEWGIIAARKYVESIGGAVVKLDYYEKLSPQRILDTLNTDKQKAGRVVGNLISTKANTLLSLKNMLTKARIEDISVVTAGEIRNAPESTAAKVRDYFAEGKIVVRSSSHREDAFESSNAGHFTSVLDVDARDERAILDALFTVMRSYGENAEDDEQVLIQRQTGGVEISGVVFTRDIQRNRPYYVINYDTSGSTDSVTSGAGGATAWMAHSIRKENVPEKWRGLMEAVWELEETLPGILLDIEFAITSKDVVIFQVRPLAAAYKFGRQKANSQIDAIRSEAIGDYERRQKKGLSCFSDMAFWNPAEIIGDIPKNLDYSLYREIITKSAWDSGLVPMGYRPVSKELMYRYGDKPYISVERSFEALMPAGISDTLADKLLHYYVKELKAKPSSHDKIEFEISHNCYDFSMHKRLLLLGGNGFTIEEVSSLENALKIMTEKIIHNYPGTLKTDLANLKKLESIRLDIANISDNNEDFRLLAHSIHTLMNAINQFGTPQFSRHARCAFIAKSLCTSLVKEEYISSEDYYAFLSGIMTVVVEYDIDYHAVLNGKMSEEAFLLRYGHLRAGTYNIRSLRYDQMEHLFPEEKRAGTDQESKSWEKTVDNDATIISALERALQDSGLKEISGNEAVQFIRDATEQREYFKFVFTKSLSLAIELIKQIGAMANISVNDLSYLEMPEIYAAEYYSNIDRLKEFWSLIIEKRRDVYKSKAELILPALLCSSRDFEFIENIDSRPNFITENAITGEVVVLDEETGDISIAGKVVCLEKADPGYDWIFSKGIAGLITKYGGAASHMAIRCAEFMIPAAIGCGATYYDYALGSKEITIDCKHEKLIRIEQEVGMR